MVNINNNDNAGGGAKSGRGVGGGTTTTYWALSEKVRNTIQSIKEIVKDHSNDEIYAALKESNMDPNETAQKLLNQDPFHEVRRKRDRKKENATETDAVNPPKPPEHDDQILKVSTQVGPNFRRGYSRSYPPQNAGPARNVLSASKEFRVVRDNRVSQNPTGETVSASQQTQFSSFDRVGSKMAERGSGGRPPVQKPWADRNHSHASKEAIGLLGQSFSSSISNGSSQKAVERDRATVSSSVLRARAVKSDHSQSQPISVGSINPPVGLYSSSTDPVHVPSPDSRSSSVVGAIKRDVGVVGGRWQTSEDSTKHSLEPGTSSSYPTTGSAYSPGSLHSGTAVKTEQLVQNGSMQSAASSSSGSKSLLTNQYAGKANPIGGNLKASQPVKEWKPKTVAKANFARPGIIGTPPKSVSSPLNNSKEIIAENVKLCDRLSELHMPENQNVIIAQHIRVSDSDRYQLTFGSFGKEFDSARNFVSGEAKDSFKEEITTSLPVSDPTSGNDDDSGGKQADLIEEQVRNSSSESPTSPASSESPLPDKKAAVPQNLDSMGLFELVRDGGRSYSPLQSRHVQRDPPEMSNFSGYETPTGYDMAYFRTSMDEPVQTQGLPSQEALTSHMANSLPATTMSLGGQQQQLQALAQMYPQVHVSHFANMMPYRQFISPVYVPPMAVPGYTGNPAYPHPSSGNSYMLMSGGGSHINTGALKYGMQQFKPVPGGSPTGFGNFANHAGYSVNSAGVVGNATGIDDSSRVKYKDSNLYIPNPQAETSEIWIQTPREVPGMQSAQYYNLPGQAPPHAAYLPHAGHASFNSGAPQSSHMQFPGLYHPSPQPPSAIANAHHLNPSMAGNLGVGVAGAAPIAQVGAYQQPQLGHLNWTSNF